MVRAILFDLFETLITESGTRPPGVSSLAPALGCERDDFRRHWKALRPAVSRGRLSFRQAIGEITTRLGSPADPFTLQRVCEQRVRTKAQPFEQLEPQIVTMLDDLRHRGLRLGVVSNCCAEDVAAWRHSSLASRFDRTVFSFEVGLAKPDPEIYKEAARRLRADVSQTWYIGDGADEELSGAEHAGLRPFRAIWFLRRWPHYREEPGSIAKLATVAEIVSVVERSVGLPDRSGHGRVCKKCD
jgi:putative hydrolase of the HAD superfamily